MPIRRSLSPSRLNIINDIVKESQKRIKRSLIEGFEYDHLVIAKSDEFLRKHVFQKLDFAVMYIDLIGSTKMSTELTQDFLSKIITVFSQEVAYVIERSQGLVLKFVGDAAIAYFPYHTFNVSNSTSPHIVLDDIVLCGEAIVHVVRDAINPLLLQMGHHGINVKVTSDYGQHTIVRYWSDTQRSHIDIISATMNLAAKMQAMAGGKAEGLSDSNDNGNIGDKGVSNDTQMVIGKMLFERLSYDLQQIFEIEKFDKISRDNNSSSQSFSDGSTYHNLAEQNPYSLFTISFPSGS